MNPNTKLGKTIRAAVDELQTLNGMASIMGKVGLRSRSNNSPWLQHRLFACDCTG
jgi:hypothetical protein